VLAIVEQLPMLRCLRLKGNPFVRNLRNYRKVVLSRMPKLEYLDDRPVFESERIRIKAWAAHLLLHPDDQKGAAAAERAAVKENAKQVTAKNKESHDFLGNMVQGWSASGDSGNGAKGMGNIFDAGADLTVDAATEERRQKSQEDSRAMRERERERFLNPKSVKEEVAGCEFAAQELSTFDPLWYSFYDQQPIDKPDGWEKKTEEDMGRQGAIGPVVIGKDDDVPASSTAAGTAPSKPAAVTKRVTVKAGITEVVASDRPTDGAFGQLLDAAKSEVQAEHQEISVITHGSNTKSVQIAADSFTDMEELD